MIAFNHDKIRQFIDSKNRSMISPGSNRKLRYSNTTFCDEIGINNISFNSMMLRGETPKLETAYRIAKGMGCNIEDLIITNKK